LLYGWATLEPDDAQASKSDMPQVPQESLATFMGQPPAAHVTLIVPLTTLLGLDQEVAEIPGHGFVPAVQARQMAMADGSVWRRLVVDPLTGAALDLSTRRYRPTRAMAD